MDKDADGRITEEEVKEVWHLNCSYSGENFFCHNLYLTVDVLLQIISLSASANKLSNIQIQAEEYAALIMEELDPDHLGYIMVNSLISLLLLLALCLPFGFNSMTRILTFLTDKQPGNASATSTKSICKRRKPEPEPNAKPET